ncbi:MAG TPA: hypothetical protein PLN13_01155 [Bacteroidia bacterium]|nr:hypothetical protein [Bacteroidia bacterium]HRH07160.1 hypothetical protein [Bacteroidia bacterium]
MNQTKTEFYDEDLQIKVALKQLFTRFNIPEDAYTAKKFSIKVGNFPINLPNIPSRVKVARFHDIHHVLTGYAANWKGEAEIGAWEIATGCEKYFVAWFLNFGALLVGIILYPKAVFKAFNRGLKTKTNLYHNFDYEPLLDLSIKELREKIGLK